MLEFMFNIGSNGLSVGYTYKVNMAFSTEGAVAGRAGLWGGDALDSPVRGREGYLNPPQNTRGVKPPLALWFPMNGV